MILTQEETNNIKDKNQKKFNYFKNIYTINHNQNKHKTKKLS